MLTEEVAEAIEEIRAQFAPCAVDHDEDGAGGAYVIVREIELGSPYIQGATDLGFHLAFQYPEADVYPLYVLPSLERQDGAPLGESLTPTSWRGAPAIQVSRRSNQRDPAVDTAALKALKVLTWLRER
ncbi:MAG: hypothetical protein WEB00_09775 [Dehalococcoidia bacterium]